MSKTSIFGMCVLLTGVTLGVPAVYSIHAALPPNAITLPIEEWIDARKWAPQGWGFFTRNPREPQILPFVKDQSGSWRSANLAPHAQAKYAFGLNRKSRAQGVEIGLLLGQLNWPQWTECEEYPVECLERISEDIEVVNGSPSPTLCGQIAFVRQEPTPWAWAAEDAEEVMPSQVIKLQISCSSP